MKRRNFIYNVSAGTVGAYLSANPLISYGSSAFAGKNDLDYHTIEKATLKKVRIVYPRYVGKNAIRGNHGWGYDETVCELVTDKGAKGWSVVLWGHSEKKTFDHVVGKKVSELISPE